jgi:hypothetical protein
MRKAFTMLAIACAVCPGHGCEGDESGRDLDPKPGGAETVVVALDVLGATGDFTIKIDGVATTDVEVEYERYAEALADTFSVETSVGGVVVDTMTVTPGTCLECELDDPSREEISLCLLASGELRFGSATCRSGNGDCIADGFCLE